jgi:hypothetical protein
MLKESWPAVQQYPLAILSHIFDYVCHSLPLSIAEVNNGRAVPPVPCTSSWRGA